MVTLGKPEDLDIHTGIVNFFKNQISVPYRLRLEILYISKAASHVSWRLF